MLFVCVCDLQYIIGRLLMNVQVSNTLFIEYDYYYSFM